MQSGDDVGGACCVARRVVDLSASPLDSEPVVVDVGRRRCACSEALSRVSGVDVITPPQARRGASPTRRAMSPPPRLRVAPQRCAQRAGLRCLADAGGRVAQRSSLARPTSVRAVVPLQPLRRLLLLTWRATAERQPARQIDVAVAIVRRRSSAQR